MPSNPGNQDIQLAQPMFVSSSTAVHDIGTRGYTADGRRFVYVLAGAVDLVPGNVLQSPAIVPNHLANTPPAVAIGATSFTYTPGATAGAANLYSDGLLGVSTTPGLGQTLRVINSPTITSSTAFTLTLDDPMQVALTTSSRVGLIPNKYRGVIQFPVTTATGVVVGVCVYVITAAQYGWVQTGGYCATLTTGTPALGAKVMIPGAAAGSVTVVVAAGSLLTAQDVGNMAQVGVDATACWVDLRIQ